MWHNTRHFRRSLSFIFRFIIILFLWFDSSSGSRPPLWGYTSTLRHTTHGKAPLEELETRRRDLYLTTQNTHKRQTSMLPAGFEPAIPTSERLNTQVLARAANYNLSNSKSQFGSRQVNRFFPSLEPRTTLGHPSLESRTTLGHPSLESRTTLGHPSLESRTTLGHPSHQQLIRNCSDVFFPEGKSASPWSLPLMSNWCAG